MQPKKHSLEFLRENAHLRVRTNAFGAIMRVRSVLAHAVHTYFQDRGFVYVNTPIITGSDAEGAGEMFKVTALPFDGTPRTEEGKVDYKKDFWKRNEFNSFGSIRRGNVCHGIGSNLYIRTYISCRKFKYIQTLSRILDDRT